jgi:hypothetical protein
VRTAAGQAKADLTNAYHVAAGEKPPIPVAGARWNSDTHEYDDDLVVFARLIRARA